jgi:hypothetical protein
MRTFIQLRDGVGYATIITPTDAPDHTVTPDHTTAIEVTGTDNPDQFLKKKYDADTKSWSEAPIIRLAEINSQGDIIEIKYTVFTHEIDHDTKLMEADTTTWHKWLDGEWVLPVTQVESSRVEPEPQGMIESPQTTEEQNVEETPTEEPTN